MTNNKFSNNDFLPFFSLEISRVFLVAVCPPSPQFLIAACLPHPFECVVKEVVKIASLLQNSDTTRRRKYQSVNFFIYFLAAIAALYLTMLVCPSVGQQRVLMLPMLLKCK